MRQKLTWPLICAATLIISVLLAWVYESRGREAAPENESTEVTSAAAPVRVVEPAPAPGALPSPPSASKVLDLPLPPAPPEVRGDIRVNSADTVVQAAAASTPVAKHQDAGVPPTSGEFPPPSSALPPQLTPPAPASNLVPPPPGAVLAGSEPPLASPPPPLAGVPQPAPTAIPPAAVTCPWTFQLAVVKGRTRFEARTGKDVQFTVICDKLNMQTPDGNIQACGDVSVSGPNVEATCEKLTLTWHEERVLLEGKVRLKCQQSGQDVDLTGEKLTIKLAAIETLPPPSPAATQEPRAFGGVGWEY